MPRSHVRARHEYCSWTSQAANLAAVFCAAIAACTGRSSTDLSDGEVSRLKDKIINEGLINVDRALAQVDSAEQAHLFTSVEANVQRALINFNDARWLMAAYYAEFCLKM
jgi:hypothetical protein